MASNLTYNPISRSFYKLRRELMAALELPRRDVYPSARLEEVIPQEKRRAVWRRLREAGLRLPGLCLAPVGFQPSLGAVAQVVSLVGFLIQHLPAALWSLPLLGFLAFAVTRPWAVHLPPDGPVTLWDAALYLTPCRECKQAGYALSRREISVKVRFILAEALNLPFEDVRPESRVIQDLGAC